MSTVTGMKAPHQRGADRLSSCDPEQKLFSRMIEVLCAFRQDGSNAGFNVESELTRLITDLGPVRKIIGEAGPLSPEEKRRPVSVGPHTPIVADRSTSWRGASKN